MYENSPVFEATLISRVIISDSSADRQKVLGINTWLCCSFCLSSAGRNLLHYLNAN